MRWVLVAVEFFWTCARSSDPQTEAARKTVGEYSVDTRCGHGAATNSTVPLHFPIDWDRYWNRCGKSAPAQQITQISLDPRIECFSARI